MKTRILVICSLLGASLAMAVAGETTARSYAGPGGKLTELQAARFVLAVREVKFSDVFGPNDAVLTPQGIINAADDLLRDLRNKAKHGAPWTWQEANQAFGIPDDGTGVKDQNGNGITTMRQWKRDGATGWNGPLRLRKNRDELAKSPEEARGATVGFVNNRLLPGNGAWNSEGILFYPIKWGPDEGRVMYALDLAAEWKSAETEKPDVSDTQELTLGAHWRGFFHPEVDYSAMWVTQVQPFLNTDFSWGHRIWGAEASVEYVGHLGKDGMRIGSFQDFGSPGRQYQLRLVPKINTSYVTREGKNTTRKLADDWFRYGLMASLDYRFVVNEQLMELGTTFEFLQQVDGGRNWSDKWTSHFTWWLNSNVGLTLENVTGDSPITDEDVDSITLGLEVKL